VYTPIGSQAEEDDPPPLWALRRCLLVGGVATATPAVKEGDESLLADEGASLPGERALLGEPAAEDDAVLLGEEVPPLVLLFRLLLASSRWAALKRSSVRARTCKNQFSQKRADGSRCPLLVSQVACSSAHREQTISFSSTLATICREVAPSACRYCLLPRWPLDQYRVDYLPIWRLQGTHMKAGARDPGFGGRGCSSDLLHKVLQPWMSHLYLCLRRVCGRRTWRFEHGLGGEGK